MAKKYTKKTAVQVKAEIKALEAIKPKVPHHSGFGDDNYAKIDAEVAVLREDLDEDAIYSRYEGEDPDAEPPPELDCALHARRWMDGEEDEGLAEGWKPAAGIK
jgi:hypothetical protein